MRVDRSALGVLGAQGVEVAAQVLAGLAAARALGPTRFGELVLAFSTAGMLAVLLLFGTGEIALRMHARREHDPRALWGAQLAVLAGGSLAACVGAALVAWVADGGWVLATAVLALLGNGLASSMNVVLLARGRAAHDLAHVVVSRGLLVALVVPGAWAGGPLGVAAVHGLAALVLVVLRARLLAVELGSIAPRFEREVLRELWSGGRRVGLGSLFGTLAARADVIVLRAVSGAEATGLYGACYRVVNGLGAIAAALSLALFPRLCAAVAAREAGAWRRFVLAPLVLATVALTSAALAEPIVVLLYGEAFRSASGTLAILLVAAAVQSGNAFLHKGLIAAGRERSLPWAQGSSAIVCLGLLAWLVPTEGPRGAAIATLTCELVVPAAHLAYTLAPSITARIAAACGSSSRTRAPAPAAR